MAEPKKHLAATQRFRLRPITRRQSDARLILEWRNDPVTRANSFRTARKSWTQFWTEYRAKYFDRGLPKGHFLVVSGRPVAFVGFERMRMKQFDRPDTVGISINVAPPERRRGYGLKSLRLAKILAARAGFGRLVALVRSENRASIRLFRAAGYVKVGAGAMRLRGLRPVSVACLVYSIYAPDN